MFLFFTMKYDSIRFYLAPKVGNRFHSNHLKLRKEQIILPPRLLNKETKAIIDKISKADGNQTIVFHTTDVMLSRNNIHWLSDHTMSWKIQMVSKTKKFDKENDWLPKEKKFNNMVLYHDGRHNQLMNRCQDESKKQWISLPPK